MVDKVILLPAAINDVIEASDWYNSRKTGLGDELRLCIEDCIDAIRRNPERFPFAQKPYRRALVKRFPYAIFFEHAADTITVYSVFHCSRNPDTWQRMLPK